MKDITVQEIEIIANKLKLITPTCDAFGNIHINTKDIMVVLNADTFHKTMKKEIQKLLDENKK